MRSTISLPVVATLTLMLVACNPTSEPDQAAIDAASGIWRSCAGCHGVNGEGNAALQAPALVNLDVKYLRRQLDNFRNGRRGSHPDDTLGAQMAAQANLLADGDDIDAVIRQIESFDDVTPVATLDGDIDRGQDLYNMTCGACHGANAVGNELFSAPSLRGVDDWYLARQLELFRDGIRGTHEDDLPGQQMQRMGKVLRSDDDIEAVASWLATLSD